MNVWLAMLGMGVVTLAWRVSFLVLPQRVSSPAGMRRALRFVPVAVLSAIWAPQLFVSDGVVDPSLGNERLVAGVVAIAVAWRLRMPFATIAAGIAALHLIAALR